MNTSNQNNDIPELLDKKSNYKTSSSVNDITVFQNESVDSTRLTWSSLGDVRFLEISTSRIPGDLVRDHSLNLEQTPRILSNAGRRLLDYLFQEDPDCLLKALGFAEDSVNEADHNDSQCSNPTSTTSDSSLNRDQLNSGWSFSLNAVSYNGHFFSIQGVQQKILKALSKSPGGLKKKALIKKVWPRKAVNSETLGSHITSIRRCIRKSLNILDDPIPHFGSGGASGYKLNLGILKNNTGDYTS